MIQPCVTSINNRAAREAEKKKESSEKNPRRNFIAPSVTINNPAFLPNFGWGAPQNMFQPGPMQ
jgi:hypothetical protein